MKKLIFILLLVPFVATAQQDTAKFEGWSIADCQKYAIREIARGGEGELKQIMKDRVTPNTKTIYIVRKKWLQNLPDTAGGMNVKFIDIDSNLKWLAKEVKDNDAVVVYMGSLEMDSKMCKQWVFPVDIKKGMMKADWGYDDKAAVMNFFFNYDPPKFYYRGTDIEQL